VSDRVRALNERGVTPGLAAVLVGEDQASRIYVGQKHKACADVGIRSEQIDLPAYVTEHELLATIRRLNRDPDIHGVLVQLPLPSHLRELEIQRAVGPEKDVDGLHPLNIGLMLRQGPCFLPATPYGIVELMLRCDVPVEGAEVCIVGYGDLVGAPLSVMLTQDSIRGNATVVSTHIKTKDLAAHTRAADIVVAAAGVPHLIRADMVKPGATVIDVGVHRTPDGLIGDVAFDEVAEVAGAITPVPGGVGPMTVAMLLVNTLQAAEAQAYT
jgi:methylenetetrahydrofolate dehydrogenase (NADP+)/methenyltetrahydrofolate cyclohydrolase